MGSFEFQSFTEIWFSLGGWVGFLWLGSVENTFKDLDPGIHAMWLWAKAVLFEICQCVFPRTRTRSKYAQIVCKYE